MGSRNATSECSNVEHLSWDASELGTIGMPWLAHLHGVLRRGKTGSKSSSTVKLLKCNTSIKRTF